MKIQAPYSFHRSVQMANRFASLVGERTDRMVLWMRIGETPVRVTIAAREDAPEELEISASAPVPAADLEAAARWILFDEFDLAPFYRMAESHPVLGPVTRELWGMKPVRPASLFEMAVTVITEQQISLAAANSIRLRLVERFGDPVEGGRVFPDAPCLAQAPHEEIVRCGYSRRKAETIQDLAARVTGGSLDLEQMKSLPDAAIYARLLALRGWGPWSANYFLSQGLARPDAVPAEDLAVRSVVGQLLGDGPRLKGSQVEVLLEPFRPYRGMAAFYLVASVWLDADNGS